MFPNIFGMQALKTQDIGRAFMGEGASVKWVACCIVSNSSSVFVLELYYSILSHILTCIISAVANTDDTSGTQGTCLFVIFPLHEVVFLLPSSSSYHFPSWLKCGSWAAILAPTGAAEPQGAQRLLSSQCRSCGAGSSYIWLLGHCWQPCYSGCMIMTERLMFSSF